MSRHVLLAALCLTVSARGSWAQDVVDPVQFHTAKKTFVCYDKTPETFSKTTPESKIIESSIRVSANINIDEREVEKIEYRLRMPDKFAVVDYLPKTNMGSEIADMKIGQAGSDRSLTVVSREGGASAGFNIPGLNLQAGGQFKAGDRSEQGKEVQSSVEIRILPPKEVINASNTEDDGRVLHFRLQQHSSVTLQGDKDYVFLAEVPRDWSGDCFTLECVAYLKGSTTPLVSKKKQVGIFMVGDSRARTRVNQMIDSSTGWTDFQAASGRATTYRKPVTPVVVEAPAAALREGELPIDGVWISKISVNGNLTPDLECIMKNGELHLGKEKVYWKDVKMMANGRYSATRISPGIFSNWEHEVELFVDPEGILRQDDSMQGPLGRSLGKVTFVVKTLDHPEAFNRQHKK